MQCPHCHNPVGPSDASCQHCGATFAPQLRFTPLAPGEKQKRGKITLFDVLVTIVLVAAVGATWYWKEESRRRARNPYPRVEPAATVTPSSGPPAASVSTALASAATAPAPAVRPPATEAGFVPDKVEPGFEAGIPTGRKARPGGIPDAPPPPPPSPTGPVRVGGNIRTPTKIRDVKPVYPSIAEAARVQGVVIAEITVAADGSVHNARIIRSIPLLDQAALDAIRQWQYTPTLINGVPAPVMMTVTVQFTLGG